jgi:2-polyprenyl-3-methyl-5-hydroxy-6-metoxy-1,4-benzoquinol methylase
VYKLDENAFLLSRNGIDLTLFHELRRSGVTRDRKKLIYAARPERGLDLLLRDIMPRLVAKDKDLRLYIASYDNRPQDWGTFYAECHHLAAAFGDRVVQVGCLPKRDLYGHYLSAGVYVYPTPSPVLSNFREVSCISAMECQAAGLPIVTTAMGALPETIAPGAGALIGKDPSLPSDREAYAKEFTERVLELVNDDAAWGAASARGMAHAEALDWSAVAREWLAEFEPLIRGANDSPERLIRHFWRTSDIVAAKRILSQTAGDQGNVAQTEELQKLVSPWTFMEEPDGYRKQYERIGSGHDDFVYQATPEEPRFLLLESWLREHIEIGTVLDYGCGHGAYAINLAQRLPHLRIHGADIDRFGVEMATTWAAKLGVAERVTFSVWTHDHPQPVASDPAVPCAWFDCALLQEVLEHVPEPWAVLERVERQVRPGGKVYFTVPFGPWEFMSYRTYPHRCHLWHFDAHDLGDMLQSKPDFQVEAFHFGDSPFGGEPLGWWIGTYRADHKPVPPVDLERHVWLQRPRQSVSVAIIAGPDSEETLHWTLRSIQDIADEIVLADCGMSHEASRIAAEYAVRIVPGVDPKTQGFERARNIALDACACDWCLWIDTDEKLVGAQALEKYLRDNVYQGYGIRQHHFACDVSIPADIPVRLFRRRPYQGRALRFWGAIHEHPELGVDQGSGPIIVLRDVHIGHVGYVVESTRRQRFIRNRPLLRLDQQRYPERLLQKHFILRDNIHMVRYALEQNGGLVDEQVRARCRETVELYQKHFLGKPHHMNRDSLPYYSEALGVLGEGFEAAFQVEADKVEAKPNGAERYRFASAEDFCTELERRAKEKTQRFDSQWW